MKIKRFGNIMEILGNWKPGRNDIIIYRKNEHE